jgi:DNA-nicking Smr family endonuclease
VKKIYTVLPKDKKDWNDFLENVDEVNLNEAGETHVEKKKDKVRKLDLHGFSLAESAEMVKKFINESHDYGYKKILVVTGKGSRSKSYTNPYVSKKLSILRYSIPEYIKNNENLKKKINKISEAEIKDGGEGAIYIFLKKKKL